MSHSTIYSGEKGQVPIKKNPSPGAILYTLSDRPRKKRVTGMLKNMGIHRDCIDGVLKSPSRGAKIIDLAEYRWMRLFDEL